MKIYSDVFTEVDLHAARSFGVGLDTVEEIRQPRVRRRGWIVRTYGNGPRWKNSGKYGASSELAATWDQHGRWFAFLFERDPKARIGWYDGETDFHAMTKDKYRRAS